MHPAPAGVPTTWTRRHTSSLTSLDPDADVEDLAALEQIVGDARVVAIGEGAHFVEEFSRVRQRVLRFLSERCGFTVFALEFSFAEAPAVDRWLRGRVDGNLEEVSRNAADWGAGGLLTWLRALNATRTDPLHFVGIDGPEAGGALRPVLDPLADYLTAADPESLPWIEQALRISDEFLADAGSVAAAAPAWGELAPARQDALTAVLTRLRLRIAALRPVLVERGGIDAYAQAERWIAAACSVDYMFGAMNDLFAGGGKTADPSVRELFMAETVQWHLRHAGPDARIVVAAHNNHIQKTPVGFDGVTTALPMGQHLAGLMGDDYVSIAVTHTDTTVPEMHPDPQIPLGFTLADADLPNPEPGSIEHALIGAGLEDQINLTDLRQAPRTGDGESLLRSIRTQSAVMLTPLDRAFDAVISTPTVTKDPSVGF